MVGNGYSGAETINDKIKYKGSPSIVGIDQEIFSEVSTCCNQLNLLCKKTKTYHGTPQLILGKNKWFREFLVRCGIEKRDKKHISDQLMNMSLENTAFLLKGLFDTDGHVEKNKVVGFSNISEKLIRQIQKQLLRFRIVSRIRVKKPGTMCIYNKEYKTVPCFEIQISQKKSILNFYKYIGFNIKRKQKSFEIIISKICSNMHYVGCNHCNYKVYMNLFKNNEWGKIKLKIIKLLGEKNELGSREIKKIIEYEPKKKENRLNHHYELIKKRKIG